MGWFGLVWAKQPEATLALGPHCSTSCKHPRARGARVPAGTSPGLHVPWIGHVSWSARATCPRLPAQLPRSGRDAWQQHAGQGLAPGAMLSLPWRCVRECNWAQTPALLAVSGSHLFALKHGSAVGGRNKVRRGTCRVGWLRCGTALKQLLQPFCPCLPSPGDGSGVPFWDGQVV